MPVEVLLELLVRVVDAELLEGVLREDLEAEDIEQADESQLVLLTFPARLCLFGCVLHRDGRVDLLHDPAEDRAVKVLDEGVTGLVGLVNCQRAIDHLATEHLALRRKSVHQLGEIDAKKPGRCRDVVSRVGGRPRCVIVDQTELYVAQVEHGDDGVKNLRDLLIREVDVFHALESELKLRDIIHAIYRLDVGLVYVVVILDLTQSVLSQEPLREGCLLGSGNFGSIEDLVEYVEVAFNAVLEANSTLL